MSIDVEMKITTRYNVLVMLSICSLMSGCLTGCQSRASSHKSDETSQVVDKREATRFVTEVFEIGDRELSIEIPADFRRSTEEHNKDIFEYENGSVFIFASGRASDVAGLASTEEGGFVDTTFAEEFETILTVLTHKRLYVEPRILESDTHNWIFLPMGEGYFRCIGIFYDQYIIMTFVSMDDLLDPERIVKSIQ
ncbi:MAG: hypothetical protein KDC26_05990 [Armatimonadetes bacterium]|nr:hypothetical protein [Armatimonadota bacterium]